MRSTSAREGQSLTYVQILAELIFERAQEAATPGPRLLLLQSDPGALCSQRRARAEALAPLYSRFAPIRRHLAVKRSDKLRFASRLYRFNSEVPRMLQATLRARRYPSDGFEAKAQRLPPERLAQMKLPGSRCPAQGSDPSQVEVVREMLARAAQSPLEVAVVFGPRLTDLQPPRPAVAAAAQEWARLLERDRIPLIDLRGHRFPELTDAALYADLDHLNAAGARVYTQRLAGEIHNPLPRRAVDGLQLH